MILTNEFIVALPKDAAMQVLTDVPLIAPCLPGVSVTEAEADTKYAGEAAVRLGPVKLTFSGRAEIIEINLAAHTASVRASGADKKGRGGAEAIVTFQLLDNDAAVEEASATRVVVTTDLTLNGSIAQYGRASGLIEGVAQELTKEFADNLATVLTAEDGTEFDAGEISGLKLLVKAGIGRLKFGCDKAKNETGAV
jgi:carbon monoxide dehydrogenase subunit G